MIFWVDEFITAEFFCWKETKYKVNITKSKIVKGDSIAVKILYLKNRENDVFRQR